MWRTPALAGIFAFGVLADYDPVEGADRGQFRRGEAIPRRMRVGRTLAYCWRGWQRERRRPQREKWSGMSVEV